MIFEQKNTILPGAPEMPRPREKVCIQASVSTSVILLDIRWEGNKAFWIEMGMWIKCKTTNPLAQARWKDKLIRKMHALSRKASSDNR